ncbi:hypothetical protein F5X98DRAFT_346871 [Xylaria grammica]|nr:hypothetical protein F5X98DRAFT_346871 [Xylaria grammica]
MDIRKVKIIVVQKAPSTMLVKLLLLVLPLVVAHLWVERMRRLNLNGITVGIGSQKRDVFQLHWNYKSWGSRDQIFQVKQFLILGIEY